MSDTTDKPTDPPSETPAETQPTTAQQTAKPIKKVKSKKDLKDDPNRFEAPGINFNAKLIGIDDVANARGDKMCQEGMTRLKLAVKQSGQHKQKIIVNVSYDGIRIMDLRTQATNHTHPVHRISFISRDITDARAFGYVYGAGEGKHKFFAIKTEKAAEALVLTLRDLFQAVYEMKKKEVEEAKHKIDEPAENAKEAEETQEPVYQVPNSKPVDGQDSNYQVPSNNTPVQNEPADLLNLENELHTMEERIEQIDTMEELFKELEAPPPANSNTNTNAQTSWASSLGGLNISQAQPTFSMGGTPFPPNNQPFPGQQQQQQPFGAPNQGFGAPAANQPFGMQAQPFGAPAPNQQQPFGVPAANQQQPFGAPAPNQQQPFGFQQPTVPGAQPTASPFGTPFGQAPNVPPRTGMPFQGQPFPGTPFPGTQPQGFPPVGQAQPNVVVTPAANDPFGSDPFQANTSAFDEGVLAPVRIEKPEEAVPSTKPQQIDVFGDLVSLGDKSKQTKTPKDMFAEDKPKKSLNEIKGSPSPKPPASPTGFQASGTPGELQIGYSSHDNVPSSTITDPFGASPFGSEDPFANDPFASSTTTGTASSSSPAQPKPAQAFGGSPFDEDDFNLPVPRGPPPPLPTDISAQNVTIEPPPVPAIPPRPTVIPPVNTPPVQATPPVPPRPRSNCSDSTASISSSNSFTESQLSPPNPPARPISGGASVSVPRPRPRPRASLTLSGDKIKRDKNDNVTKPDSDSVSIGSDTSEEKRISGVQNHRTLQSDKKSHNASVQNTHTNSVESQSSKPNGDISQQKTSVTRTVSSGSSISDPFVNTDPFVTDDPFKQSDPFAYDPFSADPFSEPAFTTNPTPKDNVIDPFTCVVPSPQPASGEEIDPFSVFDNTFSSDIFKFDRTSSKKNKLKVAGQ